MDGVTPGALDADEAGEAVRHAQAELERAVREGNLARDPMRFPLGALAVTLGAQHRLHVANVQQSRTVVTGLEQLVTAIKEPRQPLDPAALVRLEEAAATGADRRSAALARAHNLRTLLIYGGGVLALVVVVATVAFLWGRAAANVAVVETERRLAAAFQDGPGAAAAWVNLMEQNDLPHSLGLCTGPRAYTDQTGRKLCLLPVYLEPPRRTAPAEGQR